MSGTLTTLSADPVVGPLALIGGTAGVVTLVRRRLVTPARLLTVALTTLYGAAVLTLTLFPLQIATGDYANHASWIEKANIIPVLTIDVRTFMLNVLMIVPLGVLVPLLRRSCRWTTALGIGVTASAVIEVTQWLTNIFVSSGRTADVNDFVANGLGAVLGYWLLRGVTLVPSVAALATRCALHAESPLETARDAVDVH